MSERATSVRIPCQGEIGSPGATLAARGAAQTRTGPTAARVACCLSTPERKSGGKSGRGNPDIPQALAEAVARLKLDPAHPVHAVIENLKVELRVVEDGKQPTRRRGSKMAALGPWQGESMEEILSILREGRAAGGSSEPPVL